VLVIDLIAPCDQSGPIPSVPISGEMPKSYSHLSLLFNALAAIFAGVAAAIAARQRRFLAALVTWFACGFGLFVVSVVTWAHTCPPPHL
jgi:hypothetical protein